VIFTGDNGTGRAVTTQTRTGPVRGGKGGTTATGTHVPLIARWSGKTQPGVVCEDLIDFTDFLPTFAEASVGSIPASHPKDGRSFLAQIGGERGQAREWIFCDYNPRWGRFEPSRWVMDKRWKLYGDGRLFDLERDPEEKSAISPVPEQVRPLVQRFEQVLARMRPAVGG
jgi:arylsulfatase A-like enzyme